MKYFQNYNSYNLNEAKDSQSLLGKMFSYLGSSISSGIGKVRLNNISKEYSSYLYSVYAQYNLEKQLELEKGFLTDYDTEDIVNNMSRVEIPTSEEQEIKVKFDKDDVKKEIIEEVKKEDEGDEPDDTSKEIVLMSEDDPKEDSESDNESESESESDNEEVEHKPKMALKNIMIDGKKIDVSRYNIDSVKWDGLSAEDKEITTKNILNSDEQEDVIVLTQIDLAEAEEKVAELTDEKNKEKKLMANTTGEYRRNKQETVNDITIELEKWIDERDGFLKGLEELEIELKSFQDLGINRILKESVDWTGDAIYHNDWTNEDKISITGMVNPYKVEEFFIRAEEIVDDAMKSKTGDKKSDFKLFWEKKVNNIHVKWNYVFDIEELRNKRKNIFKGSSKKITKNNTSMIGSVVAPFINKEESFKKEVSISSVMDKLYGNDTKKYSSYDDYYRINSSDSEYYIFPFGDKESLKLLLMKKEVFFEKDKKYVFKIIGELMVEDKELYLEELYNTREYNQNLSYNKSKSIDLYYEEDEYPIIFIHKEMIFSSEGLEHLKYIDHVMISLYSMEDSLVHKIFNNKKSIDLDKPGQMSDGAQQLIKEFKI